MPSVIAHGIMGYLLFGEPGLIYGILPDLVGFSYYFTRIGLKNYNLSLQKLLKWSDIFPQSKMNKLDWSLYNISHSLILWIAIYYATGDKSVYAAIFAIVLDIFMHNDKIWSGPSFLYPLSSYRFNGIHWLDPCGLLITFALILLLLLMPQDKIQEFIDFLP